jgi:DNA-binding ferritin-like protein
MTSTLKRLLSEYEEAAQEVLKEIKRVKKSGDDNEATLYSASSLIHQKSKSILRQLEKEADKMDAASVR